MSGFVTTILSRAARLAELHPYSWKLAWEAIHHLPFLLPHDKSYRAIRHFVRAKPTGLFLDVGANDGISALSFRRFSKDYEILSLEPNPLLETSLKRLQERDPKFQYRIVGAGARPGRFVFFVPTFHRIVLHTFAATSREQVREAVSANFGPAVAARTHLQAFEADIIPGDALNVRPGIIKIDAEGFDFQVLTGLYQTIAAARPFVIIEATMETAGEVRSFFDSLSYLLFGYDLDADEFTSVLPGVLSGRAHTGHRNAFAIPREMINLMPIMRSGA